eukprot:TRINITY_DN398_c0_g1_i1.p1 TRINITY_DN398_c0_g1~~TRINITY_DN398_c0_g1_i1.p1  ORF type:complete len:316 (-),score=105.38 TRINITY_DN398_c0_g1_i1:326-1273(-)
MMTSPIPLNCSASMAASSPCLSMLPKPSSLSGSNSSQAVSWLSTCNRDGAGQLSWIALSGWTSSSDVLSHRRSGKASAKTLQCRAFSPLVLSSSYNIPTVSDTKASFLNSYRKPIPSLYSNVIQELLVQQHLVRYNSTYLYDPVFALGFVTVFDQLMDGFPYPSDSDAIFRAYIGALTEDPDQYRKDAAELEEWAAALEGADALISFKQRDGPVETVMKRIAARATGEQEGGFHYSRFFAIGLFRLLELVKASTPATLEKLCAELGVDKLSVNRDLDVYRGLLGKLTQAKELLKDFLEREKVKQAEREKEKAKAE